MSDRELTLIQHLSELRRRVMISVVAVLAGGAVSFAFFERIIEWLVRPARDLEIGAEGQLIFTEVTELLTTSIKVSFVAGLIIALPIVLYQAIMFVAPGLTPKERRYLLSFLPGGDACFRGWGGFRLLRLDAAGPAFLADLLRRYSRAHD